MAVPTRARGVPRAAAGARARPQSEGPRVRRAHHLRKHDTATAPGPGVGGAGAGPWRGVEAPQLSKPGARAASVVVGTAA